jgi:hypothetical protein
MNFTTLVQSIRQTHTALQQQAAQAINRSLTIRNWLIGYYIVEFEQKGEDKATYGEKLLQRLAKDLNNPGLSYRNLKLFRQFYQQYPQIGQTVSAQLGNGIGFNKAINTAGLAIGQTVSAGMDNKLFVSKY